MNNPLSQFQNAQFCLRSSLRPRGAYAPAGKAKLLTTGIYSIFRGLKSEPDAEIGQKGVF